MPFQLLYAAGSWTGRSDAAVLMHKDVKSNSPESGGSPDAPGGSGTIWLIVPDWWTAGPSIDKFQRNRIM